MALAFAQPALGRDPGRWIDTGVTRFQVTHNQGITVDPQRSLYFDGTLLSFNGLFRTDATLHEAAGVSPVIPASVTAADGFNHIGDLSWDPGEGGRILLPLECYTPGGPNGGNTCGKGGFAVADPATLQWRYYVRLDPADIPKAMWVETSPDGNLVWTSAGKDLLAYRSADINPANAAPAGPLLKPVVRLAGAVPPSGITGTTFYKRRLYLAGNQGDRFQVWSVDAATGKRRFEIERTYVGEPEGLAFFTGLGGRLHAQILPTVAGKPTFGPGHGALVNFAPFRSVRLRLSMRPGHAVAGRPTRFRFRVTFKAFGGHGSVSGATIRFAGRGVTTNARGRASLRAVLRTPGRYRAHVRKRGFRSTSASARAR